ncbi:hypothetical protein AnigIFM63326_010320 [Aspergillus niger]|nr:hypothetical protein AnigIFM63326_010320 [Aspergillus niger]
MRALAYTGLNGCEVRNIPIPRLQYPTDAVVRMIYTSICGTDLHILKGDVPTVEKGRILGHEGVGTIASLGSAVPDFFVNDLVLISCISACGICSPCSKGMRSHCTTGGWELGNVIDGTQAEYVRIPHASSSLYKLPGNAHLPQMVSFSDALPTGLECGTLNANIKPGTSLAIVGSGPVGLAAMMTARLYSPSLIVVMDIEDSRLEHASRLGANKTINMKGTDAMEELESITGGKGFDAVIEAAGTSSSFELCQRLLGPGATLANIGVHGENSPLALGELWNRNISGWAAT